MNALTRRIVGIPDRAWLLSVRAWFAVAIAHAVAVTMLVSPVAIVAVAGLVGLGWLTAGPRRLTPSVGGMLASGAVSCLLAVYVFVS